MRSRLILTLAAATLGTAALALPPFVVDFNKVYKPKPGSALAKGNCAVCHIGITRKLNPYGLDLKKFTKNKKLDAAKCVVGDIMSLEVVTLKQNTGLYDALEQIKESGSRVRRFPIVDENGAIKGIITLDDVIDLLGKEMSDVAAIIESERPRL